MVWLLRTEAKMHRDDLEFYRHPITHEPFTVQSVQREVQQAIIDGTLTTRSTDAAIPIINGIPRFVPESNYADNFGFQWNQYRLTQIDRENDFNLSSERFYSSNHWDTTELANETILDAGCGAGRFTAVTLASGATVYAFDISTAVDANWHTHQGHSNLHLSQADIYQLPYPLECFDRIYCYGVLQHTPDPELAFKNLVRYLKPGGQLSVDVYSKTRRPSRWNSKYIWRPITKRISPERLLAFIRWYIPKWLPVDDAISKIPFLGWVVPSLIPCWNYRGIFDLSEEQRVEWAILDTFDALSPQYDFPQTLPTLQRWFEEAGLEDIDVFYGGNGIVGNGRTPHPHI
jgi:SAM-dependent methyltransferase